MKELIEKYFAEETSLEEEAQLRAYFNGKHIDANLQQYQPLFQYFEQERRQELNNDFEQKLLHHIKPATKVFKLKIWQRRVLQMAAIGLLIAGSFLFLKPNKTPPQTAQTIDWSKYEITDEKLAYDETKKALELLASKLSKGSKKTKKEISKVEKASKVFN